MYACVFFLKTYKNDLLQPPKIYGIKVYDKNTSRNEIILDADIMYVSHYFFHSNILKKYVF